MCFELVRVHLSLNELKLVKAVPQVWVVRHCPGFCLPIADKRVVGPSLCIQQRSHQHKALVHRACYSSSQRTRTRWDQLWENRRDNKLIRCSKNFVFQQLTLRQINLSAIQYYKALCGYHLVKVEVEKFVSLLPFSQVPIFSDNIFGVCYLFSFTFKIYLGAEMTTGILN